MMTSEEMIMYDMMVEMEIATPQELNLARCLVSGTQLSVLMSVLYVRTGYRTIEQMFEEEDE